MEAAKTATHKLAEAMEKEGEVAIFVQDSVSTTATQRVQGFLDTIKASYPKISVVHVYYMDQLEAMQKTISDKKNASLQPGEQGIKPETVTQEDVVRYVLEQFPNLKGVYATNLETTQLVGTVLSSLKITDLNFVGFDGGKEQMKLMESNVLDGIILQNPYAMGYATVVAAIRTTLGLPNESFVNSGFTWVTTINKEDKGIKPMLY
jgi:ribose transport system substrate-binding protein